jgi:hypothetical protein
VGIGVRVWVKVGIGDEVGGKVGVLELVGMDVLVGASVSVGLGVIVKSCVEIGVDDGRMGSENDLQLTNAKRNAMMKLTFTSVQLGCMNRLFLISVIPTPKA